MTAVHTHMHRSSYPHPDIPQSEADAWGGITVTIETITPEIAARYLEMNIDNRNPKPNKIRQFTDDMANFVWRVNGETLKFSPKRLLDGQNRLMACIAANVPFTTLVVRGLDDEHDQMTMDVNATRSYADVLRFRGVPNASQVAAAVRGVHAWTHGLRNFSGGGGGTVAFSHTRLDETFYKYPQIVENIKGLERIYRHTHVPVGVLAGLWWQFNQLDVSDAEFFFDRLCSDELHEEGSPIFALRRYLNNLDRSTHQPDRTLTAAIITKAWNAYRAGVEIKTLMWKAGGANPEPFPEPK